jgi:hypothetical protein
MDGLLVPYKNADIRRQKARQYTAEYCARQKKLLPQPEARYCLFCESDIRNMRSDAKFCCRQHKRLFSDAKRDHKLYYAKNKDARQKQALNNYHANLDKNRQKQLERQKLNPALYAAHTAKRRAALLQRTPKWLTDQDFADIKKFYALAHELSQAYGFLWHVDHIIPLQGKTVSGLHVVDNLQIIPANVNIAKNNKFEAA